MSDILRTILALALVLLIVLIFNRWFFPSRPTIPKEEPVTEPVPTEPVVEVPTPPLPEPDSIILENDKLRLVFEGPGLLRSARLKDYDVELIPAKGRALRLWVEDESLALDHYPFQASLEGAQARYWARLPSGLEVRKVYELKGDYDLLVSVKLSDTSKGYALRWDGLATTEPNPGEDLNHFRLLVRRGGAIKAVGAKDLAKLPEVGQLEWVGLKSKYFFVGVRDLNGLGSLQAWRIPDTIDHRIEERRIGFGLSQPGSEVSYEVFIGPLKYDLLRSYGVGYDQAVDLGARWFKPFSLAILWLITRINGVLGNYGWTIVVFAILFKLIFFPLTHRTTHQTQKMQLLEPKLAELRRKYRDDPQRLNRETMHLYRLYGINPVSGCLPLLIQMPIFFALYSVFRSTIELRQAGFIGWLTDLSVKDPYYVLPILMGVSFLAQSFLGPTQPKQRWLQWGMAVFMALIFLRFPSGLQLYWFVFNILSMTELVIARKGGVRWLKQTASTK